MEQPQKPVIPRRMGAFIIDHFIITIILAITFIVVWELGSSNSAVSLLPVAFILYVCRDLLNGRSVGKRIFGLAVRNIHNDVPTAGKLIIRNLFTFLWPIELLLVLASRQKKKMGDRLAGTNVIQIAKNKGIVGLCSYLNKMNPTRWPLLILRPVLILEKLLGMRSHLVIFQWGVSNMRMAMDNRI